MKITDVPFGVIDWEQAVAVEYRGLTGTSFWRTMEAGNVRVRMVDYSAGFGSDHWCDRGHVLLVLAGELHVDLKDGRKITLIQGQSFCVSDDAHNPHYVSTEIPTRVFIVD